MNNENASASGAGDAAGGVRNDGSDAVGGVSDSTNGGGGGGGVRGVGWTNDNITEIGGDAEIIEEMGGSYDEASLPAHACSYCGIHAPASVLKCVATGKWFV